MLCQLQSTVVCCVAVLLAGSVRPAAQAASPSPTNVVVILADDLGWQDLGCYGADLHETPHIDQLASEGVRFTQAYAMSVCSPSRAALLTGRHPARLRMTIWSEGSRSGPRNRPLLQAESRHDLPHEETTLATSLQQAGWLTALIGKWHLGDADHAPETHGFDINIGGTHWGAPHSFFWPYRGRGRFGPGMRYVPHLEFGDPGEYLTDRLTDEALTVIDHAASQDQPFFLLLSHHAPHTPIQAKPEDVAHFEARLSDEFTHQNATYAAMVRSLDQSVGRVRERLAARGLSESTIVIFVSDNGGYIGNDRNQTQPVTSNAPLRSGKGSLYEGGIRVPLIVHWPELTQPNSVCQEPVILMDLCETLRSLMASDQPDRLTDGVDLRPLLANPSATASPRDLFFHYPHYYPTTTPVGSIRSGNWKLLEYFEDGRTELYDLATDPSEQHNLVEREPRQAAALRDRLHAWRKEVSAAMPTPNPDAPGNGHVP